MKKFVAFVCAAMMAFGTVASAAGPSITTVVESTAVVTGGTGKVEGTVSVSKADPTAYKSETAKAAVALLNDSDKTPTMEELAEALELDTTEVKTAQGTDIDLKEFKAVALFMELGTDGEEKFTMTEKGTVVAEITADVLKDVDPENLGDYVILFVDPETGDVTVIELDKEKFDAATGKVEVEFPALGTFTILEKNAAE